MTTTTPNPPVLTANDLLTALKALQLGRPMSFISVALNQPEEAIEAAVRRFGWPNREQMRHAAAELEAGRFPKPLPTAPARVEQVDGLVQLRVEDLIPNPNNPRERLTDIEDLAASIAESGLIQPIIVQRTEAGFVIVAGHRRHAAVKRLGWFHVECIVRKELRPDAELVTMLVENGQRAGLDPIEEARAINQLVAQGMTQAAVAAKIGRSPVHVNQRLMLLSLPVEEQEALRAGHSTIGSAVEQAKVATGRVGTGKRSKNPGWHFSYTHALSAQAKARCTRLKHSRSRRVSGGIACGECWESVVRADERQHLHAHSARQGICTLCSGVYGAGPDQDGATS